MELFGNMFKERNKNSFGAIYNFPLDIPYDQIKIYDSHLHTPPFEFALDIACHRGEPIFSPVDGIIINLKQDSGKWIKEDDPENTNPNKYLNWVTIQVCKKEKSLFSNKIKIVKMNRIVEFCHIGRDSVQHRIGDRVSIGEVVGRVGLNGITTVDSLGRPEIHLHMVVGSGESANNPLKNFQSEKIFFNGIPDLYGFKGK